MDRRKNSHHLTAISGAYTVRGYKLVALSGEVWSNVDHHRDQRGARNNIIGLGFCNTGNYTLSPNG
jgi:hypothetical protein